MQYYADLGREDLSERFFANVRQSMEGIVRSPNAGSPKHFENVALAGMRSWAVSGFKAIRIYYLSQEDLVAVIRILHGHRDIEGLLNEESDDS
jgi:toxin ParE1/3/4